MDVAVAEYLDVAEEVINRGGPEVSEYEYLKNIPQGMSLLTIAEQKMVYELLSPLLTVNSMLGFTFQKPHGYAGDYELINRIYSQWVSTDNNLSKWDHFFHSLEAAEAVRNREPYFIDLVNKTESRVANARILNLGSGPCRDLYGFLSSKRQHQLRFECLDMDKVAIDFGETVCDNYLEHVTFINKNALKFDPGYQYDLIWSAGLFDYFNDKIFIRLVRRIYNLLETGGELVIGNFSTDNPSKEIMELYGQWYLHHRDAETLTDLGLKAGIPKECINVSQEKVGVNLFLHLRKN